MLATGIVVLAFLSFACGLILNSVARGRKEIKRLAYLAVPGGAGFVTVRHVAGAAGPPDAEYDADVVILALDRALETEAAIASALAKQGVAKQGVARHLFVVDQGSAPETLARLAQAIDVHREATLVSWLNSRASRRGVFERHDPTLPHSGVSMGPIVSFNGWPAQAQLGQNVQDTKRDTT